MPLRRSGRTALFPSSTPAVFIAHPGAYSVNPFTTHLVASVSHPWMRTAHCALWSRTNRAQINRLSRARTRTARPLRHRRLISEDNLEGTGSTDRSSNHAGPRNRASSVPVDKLIAMRDRLGSGQEANSGSQRLSVPRGLGYLWASRRLS
jgi:hypothetical protein